MTAATPRAVRIRFRIATVPSDTVVGKPSLQWTIPYLIMQKKSRAQRQRADMGMLCSGWAAWPAFRCALVVLGFRSILHKQDTIGREKAQVDL